MVTFRVSPDTPLWATAYLPLKGGDSLSPQLSPIISVAGGIDTLELPISPLEGEMPGRAEGGAPPESHSVGYSVSEPAGKTGSRFSLTNSSNPAISDLFAQ